MGGSLSACLEPMFAFGHDGVVELASSPPGPRHHSLRLLAANMLGGVSTPNPSAALNRCCRHQPVQLPPSALEQPEHIRVGGLVRGGH